MKLNQLRDFTAVAERGSLRAAARHLGLAQPALTKSIRELEHELGVALFERRSRGVILTEMGKVFLDRALSVQQELRRAREELLQLKGETSGNVTVGLSTVAHICLLPKVLAPFRARYPGVFLRVVEGLMPAVEPGLRDGSFDFYVGALAETVPAPEFRVETLFENTRVIFGRKNHPLRGAQCLADLSGARWITTTVTLRSDAELGPLFASYGLAAPAIEMQATSALTMILAAANSDLLMMLPEQWLDFPTTRELLDPIPVVETLRSADICIISRARLPLTPAAEYLSDLFRRAAQYHVAQRTARQA